MEASDRSRPSRLPAPAGQVVLVESLACSRTWEARLVGLDREGCLVVAFDDAPEAAWLGGELWVSIQDRRGVYCFGSRSRSRSPGGVVRLEPPTSVQRTDDRRHARADDVLVPVTLWVLGSDGIDEVDGVATSIGDGGVRVGTPHPLVPGDPVGLTLVLDEQGPVHGVGRVVAVGDEAHVELTDLEPSEHLRLAAWVAGRV